MRVSARGRLSSTPIGTSCSRDGPSKSSTCICFPFFYHFFLPLPFFSPFVKLFVFLFLLSHLPCVWFACFLTQLLQPVCLRCGLEGRACACVSRAAPGGASRPGCTQVHRGVLLLPDEPLHSIGVALLLLCCTSFLQHLHLRE